MSHHQAEAQETINLITGKPEPDKSFGIIVLDTLANLAFLTLASGYVVFSCPHKCAVNLSAFAYLLFLGCIGSVVLSVLFYMFRMKTVFSFYIVGYGYYQNILGIYALIQVCRGKNDCRALAPELNLLAWSFGLFVIISLVLGVVKGIYVGSAASLKVRKLNDVQGVQGVQGAQYQDQIRL